MEELIKRAESGDAEAQLELAKSYHSGEGLEENQELALYWLKKSAQQDNVDAQFLLGLSYYYGDGIEENHERAVDWWKRAAEKGNKYAQSMLATCYECGDGTDMDKEQAFVYCKRAAEQGLVDAQAHLSYLYYYGIGTDANKKETYKWAKKSAEGNWSGAFAQLAFCYEYGIGTRRNKAKALAWYIKAAEEGDVEVQNHLAQEHFGRIKIEETDENKEKILKWARMGAKLGNADAQFKLGTIYYEGKIVEPDHQLAMYWLKKAYEEGKDAAFDVIKEICMAKRKTPGTIDMNELNELIVKLEELKEFYNQSGDLEKIKLASNLVQELTEGTNRDAWIPFAQSWVELYESRS